MFIDNLKFKANNIQENWKRFLAKKLIDIVTKLNYEEIKRVEIGTKVKVDIARYIPQDNEWHHFAITTDFYIKNHEQKQATRTYVDGERTNRKKRTISKRQEKLNNKEK